jgi:hypothetical protein
MTENNAKAGQIMQHSKHMISTKATTTMKHDDALGRYQFHAPTAMNGASTHRRKK